MHPGTGPGLPTYKLGQKAGHYEKQLTVNELPSHNHMIPTLTGTCSIPCVEDDGTSAEVGNNNLANAANGESIYSPNTADATLQSPGSVSTNASETGNAGGEQPFNMMNPFQGINFIIALQGIYPPRN